MISRKRADPNPKMVEYVRNMLDYLEIERVQARNAENTNLQICRVAVFAFEDSIGFGLVKKKINVKSLGFLEKSEGSLENLERQKEHKESVEDILEKMKNPRIGKPKTQKEIKLSSLEKVTAKRKQNGKTKMLRVNRSEEDLLTHSNDSKKRKSSLKDFVEIKKKERREEVEMQKKQMNRIESLEKLESIISHELSDKETEKSRKVQGSMNNLSLYIRDTISRDDQKRKLLRSSSRRRSWKLLSRKWGYSLRSCSFMETFCGKRLTKAIRRI